MGAALKMMDCQPIGLARQPMKAEGLVSACKDEWPEFLRRADESHSGGLSERLASDQLLLQPDEALLGASPVLPCLCRLTDKWVLITEKISPLQASESNEIESPASTLVVLTTMPSLQSRTGDSVPDALKALYRLARRKGCGSFAMPVRLSQKSEYPLIPFAQYVDWQQSNGRPFDPELRMHVDMGGSILAIAPRALVLEGSVAEWERWSGMRFAESGEYIVDGALRPVIIDCENNRGYYEEANIWVLHHL
jgi:hypothetical protein